MAQRLRHQRGLLAGTSSYDNGTANALYTRQFQTLEPKQRARVISELVQVVNDDVMWVWIGAATAYGQPTFNPNVLRSAVKGFYYNPTYQGFYFPWCSGRSDEGAVVGGWASSRTCSSASPIGLVLLGVSAVVFFLLRGMPGVDPLAAYIAPGLPISQDALIALRRELRLDEPLPVQYLYYVSNLLELATCNSRTAAQPVLEALLGRLPG